MTCMTSCTTHCRSNEPPYSLSTSSLRTNTSLFRHILLSAACSAALIGYPTPAAAAPGSSAATQPITEHLGKTGPRLNGSLRLADDGQPPPEPGDPNPGQIYVPFQGSSVYVKPVATVDNPAPAISNKVIRLPATAGLVISTQTTDVLQGSTSWLVEGNEYWSLCAPRRTAIACTPLTLTSTMRDIEIRAYTGADGTPLVAYNINPKTTRTAAELALSMDYFQQRLNKRVAAYMMNPNKDSAPLEGTKSELGVIKLLSIDNSVSCTIDDTGCVECSGGDGGGAPDSGGGDSGGGTDAWEWDWTPDEPEIPVVRIVGNPNEPEPPPPPAFLPIQSYPGGGERGDDDPCRGPDGSNQCQQVIITASLPVPPTGCIFTPIGRICHNTPPIVIDPWAPPPPPKATPWFPQPACNLINALCSAGQTPDNDRVEPNGDTYADAVEACSANLDVDEGVCYSNRAIGADVRTTAACVQRARGRYAECLTTARRQHNVGGGKFL